MFVLPENVNYNPNLSTRVKNFLRALADHCGNKSVCWPSQKRISQFMGCTTRTVQRAEREAVELGLVRVKRRWLKSNIYYVLCLEERLSTIATQSCRIEQNDRVHNNVGNAVDNSPPKRRWVPPEELSVLLEDIGSVMGNTLLEQNRGFYVKIIRSATASYEIIQNALRFVKCSILEGECTGDIVHNPSGLFWWILKKGGVRI